MEINKFVYALIVCISMHRSVSAATTKPPITPSPSPTPPHIQYSCKTGKSVEIEVTEFFDQGYYMVGPEKTGQNVISIANGSCAVEMTRINKTKLNNIMLTNCGKTFYLYLMEEALSKKIIGGNKFYEYEISCEIPDEGIVQTVAAQTMKPDVPSNFNKGTPDFSDISVTMTIDKLTPAIGEEVHIKITENGKQYFVLPVNCSATGATADEQIQLMNNGISTDQDIMTKFTATNGTSTASLYAFRFMTTDTVKLQCVVVVCKDNTCTPGYTRRRRSVNGGDKRDTFEVSAEYKIMDVTSGKPREGYSLLTVTSLVLTSTFVSMKSF